MSIDKKLINSFVRATERAAYGASLYRGKNDKIAADQAAVDEMRKQLNLAFHVLHPRTSCLYWWHFSSDPEIFSYSWI